MGPISYLSYIIFIVYGGFCNGIPLGKSTNNYKVCYVHNMTLKSPISSVELYFLHEFEESTFSATSIEKGYSLVVGEWKSHILYTTYKTKSSIQYKELHFRKFLKSKSKIDSYNFLKS